MKPYLEKAIIVDESSWSMIRVPRDPIPFEWHNHPEYELTLTTNSRGFRYIGDNVGPYDDGDLVLLGPNLAHTWESSSKLDPAQAHQVMVLKFRPDWASDLTRLLTELRPIDSLLERARRGLHFSPQASELVRARIESIFDREPADRLLDFIGILLCLAKDDAARPLTSPNHQPFVASKGATRIDRVMEYIHAHYRDEVKVEDLARIAALSASAFHRMFLRHTRLTLIDYVMRLRVGEACSRLIAGDQSIAGIAEDVGYRSLANFGRQFKSLKGLTPREYRTRFKPMHA